MGGQAHPEPLVTHTYIPTKSGHLRLVKERCVHGAVKMGTLQMGVM